MKKKIASLMLALSLCMGLSVPTMAAENYEFTCISMSEFGGVRFEQARKGEPIQLSNSNINYNTNSI